MKKKRCCKGCDGFLGCEFVCEKYLGREKEILEDLLANKMERIQRLQAVAKKRRRPKKQKKFDEKIQSDTLRRINKACKNCLKWLTIGTKGDFCSKKCQKEYENKHKKTLQEKELPERKCLECGCIYEPAGANQWFCSKKCRDKHNKYSVRVHVVACEVCGKRFMQTRADSRFCSNECRRENEKRYQKETIILSSPLSRAIDNIRSITFL